MKNFILCVGMDMTLLELRKQVLATRDYISEIALPREVNRALLSSGFDLVVLSAQVRDTDKREIVGMVPVGTAVLLLENLVGPDELFELVERSLAS